MSELWLIAHKVRGEPAFDVATRMDCPECQHVPDGNYVCHECDETGFWWIIPTSGHRAYPWDYILLKSRIDLSEATWGPMPKDLPDHYQTRGEPSRIEQLMAMLPPKPVYRRF